MNKATKIIIGTLLSFITLIVLMVLFSPFGRGTDDIDRHLEASIIIDKPVETVYQYLGKSANAATWSTYVDHISPLNASEVPDGKVGSVRRCFTQADEKGATWDEMILIADPNQKRQLSIYNLQNFTLKTEGLATEQIYEPLSEDRTKLTFSLFYMNDEERLTELLKTYFAAYRIKYIFDRNLENIKKEIEGTPAAKN